MVTPVPDGNDRLRKGKLHRYGARDRVKDPGLRGPGNEVGPGLIYFRKRFLMGLYKGGAYIRVGLYMDDLLC